MTVDITVISQRVERQGRRFKKDLDDSQESWQYIIRGHSHVEHLVKYAIGIKLPKSEAFSGKLKYLSFDASIDLLESLGVPVEGKKKSALSQLASLRNKFAHDPFENTEITPKLVGKLYDSMHSEQLKGFEKFKSEFKEYRKTESKETKYLVKLLICIYSWLSALVIQIEIENLVRKSFEPKIKHVMDSIFHQSGG